MNMRNVALLIVPCMKIVIFNEVLTLCTIELDHFIFVLMQDLPHFYAIWAGKIILYMNSAKLTFQDIVSGIFTQV